MLNFVQKKDRRMSLVVLLIALYVVVFSIAEFIAQFSSLSIAVAGREVTDALAIMLAGFPVTVFSVVIEIITSNFILIAIAVLLCLRIHHWTQSMPGALGAWATVVSVMRAFLNVIGYLAEIIKIGTLHWTVLVNITFSILSICCSLITLVGWMCYVFAVLSSTIKGIKLVGLSRLFAVGSCLVFVGGVGSCSVTVISAIFSILSKANLIYAIGSIIGALILAAANLVGIVAMLMICAWFINPAKRGYVPTEREAVIVDAPVEEAAVDTTAEEAEEVEASAEEIPTETV